MSFKIDSSKFKKISSDKEFTTMRHSDGHTLKIRHASLSPQLQKQISSLPEEPKMAEGGDPTQQHLLPGDSLPNKIEKAVVTKERQRFDNGGMAQPSSTPSPQPKSDTAGYSDVGDKGDWQDQLVKAAHVATHPSEWYAKGGKVQKFKDGGSANLVSDKATEDADEQQRQRDAEAYNADTATIPGTAGPVPGEADIVADNQRTQAARSAYYAANPLPPGYVYPPEPAPILTHAQQMQQMQKGSESGWSPADAQQMVPWDNSGQVQKFAEGGEEEPVKQEQPDANTRLINDKAAFYQTKNPGMSLGNAMAKAAMEQQAGNDRAAEQPPTEQENFDQSMASLPETPEDQTAPAPTPQGVGPMQASAPTGTPQQPQGQSPMTFQQAATSGAEMAKQGYEMQQAGLAEQAKQEGLQGEANAAAFHQNQIAQQKYLTNFQNQTNHTQNEINNVLDDFRNQHIDPGHYMKSKGDGGRIVTAIALIAGGLGGALTGQESAPLKFLNAQIERDVAAQQANLNKKGTMINALYQQMGNARDAVHMYGAIQSNMLASQLQEAAAKAQGPMAQARLKQAAGHLQQQFAPQLQQMNARKAALTTAGPNVDPARMIPYIVPQDEQKQAFSDLDKAKNLYAIRDNVLESMDQLYKINTLGNRLANPVQSSKQIDAIKGPMLDKLTKDTSGRVTPETVHLVGQAMNTLGADPKTYAIQRKKIDELLTPALHFDRLQGYGMDLSGLSRYDANGVDKQAGPEMKTMGGVQYQKVPGGWKRAQ